MIKMLDINNIRKDFKILGNTMNGKPLTYLDSAATALKPKMVLEAMDVYNVEKTANVHRGVYQLGAEATKLYEDARKTVAKFLGAESEREIVFTRGVTEALNLVATGYGLPRLKPGDEILTSELEHHSSFLPWQQVAKLTGATLKLIPLSDEGRITVDGVKSVLTSKTKVIAINYVSNVMGFIAPIKEICQLAKSAGALTVIDAAQAAPHLKIDVQALGCDFLAITAHKLYGPTGTGALYGRFDILNDMEPMTFGGEMIDLVEFEQSTFKEAPMRFEAGTPPIAGAIGLAAATEYVENIGWENIHNHELNLRDYALSKMKQIDGVTIFNPNTDLPLISFNLDGVHPHDMATIYDVNGVCVRAGHHCAQPLMRWLKQPATLRASFSIYNTKEDVDALVGATIAAKETFKDVI